jgi:hypothetical protein
MSGGTTMKAAYEFVGTEAVDGVDTAKITVTPIGDKTSTGSFTYWVDMQTGMAVKANGTISSESGGGKMVMTLDVKKV